MEQRISVDASGSVLCFQSDCSLWIGGRGAMPSISGPREGQSRRDSSTGTLEALLLTLIYSGCSRAEAWEGRHRRSEDCHWMKFWNRSWDSRRVAGGGMSLRSRCWAGGEGDLISPVPHYPPIGRALLDPHRLVGFFFFFLFCFLFLLLQPCFLFFTSAEVILVCVGV